MLLFPIMAFAQRERSLNLLVGVPYATEFGGESSTKWKPKGGWVLGLDYWAKNKRGDAWSAGIAYTAFKRTGDVTSNNQTYEQKETYEYLKLHGMPLTWLLDKKARWFAEAGAFSNILLSQQTEVRGSVTNNIANYQKVYLGLSGGLGVRLGDPASTTLLIGLRNDLGLASFGSAPKSLKFNALNLYVGLGI